MNFLRAVLAAASLSILLSSCGENFRPIAIPQPGSGPPSQASKTAIVFTQNAGVGSVTDYNLSGGTISGQATLGQGTAHATKVGGGTRIYAANATDNTVSVFVTASPQAPAPTTITLPNSPTQANPQFVFPSPSSSVVYVAYTGRNSIGVINTASNTATSEVGLAGTQPVALITNQSGSKLYSANFGSNNVNVIDTATFAVTTLDFGGQCSQPTWFTITPDGSFVHVICKGSANLFFINTVTNDVAGPVALGPSPNFAVFDTAKKRLIVTNSGSNTVSFLNEDPAAAPSDIHAVTTVTVGMQPISATALADGSRVYVANSDGTVTVIDSTAIAVTARAVKTTIFVGGQPKQIVSSADNLKVAVTADGASPALKVIDTSSETIATSFTLIGQPSFMLIAP